MNVLIPTPLLDYTRQSPVAAHNATLAEVLADLDARYPGIRFRMVDEQDRLRPHVRFFVNGRAVHELTHTLTETDELAIVQALSGG
jgi:sulfur carrier protein ThiS